MAAKFNNKLVTLCTVAVGAVYAAGYAITEPQVSAASKHEFPLNTLSQNNRSSATISNDSSTQTNHENMHSSSHTVHSTKSQLISTKTSKVQSTLQTNGSSGTSPHRQQLAQNKTTSQSLPSQSGSSAPTKTTSSSTSTSHRLGPYRDGTYHGYGTNSYGSVGVQVIISQGRISSCQITQCTTHYPQSYIDPQLPDEVLAHQTWQIDAVSGATFSTQDFEMAVYQALMQAK